MNIYESRKHWTDDIDWKWIEKIENLKYELPKGVVINKVDLWDDYWKKKGKHNPDYKSS